jgi:molecular chaperone GrpE
VSRGIDLIYKQFLDVLGKFGLKPIEAIGHPFDPNFHQAISTVQRRMLRRIPLSKSCGAIHTERKCARHGCCCCGQ